MMRASIGTMLLCGAAGVRLLRLFAFSVVTAQLMAFSAAAEVYRYTDDQGRLYFVTNPDDIPEQYRNQIKQLQRREPPPENRQEPITEPESEPPAAEEEQILSVPDDYIAWFKGSALAAASAGSAVEEWVDVRGIKALQPQEQYRPTVAYTPQGGAAARFDGRDDYLVADEVAHKLAQMAGLTVVAVVRREGTGAQYVWSMHSEDKSGDVARLGFLKNDIVRVKATDPIGSDYYETKVKPNEGEFGVYSLVIEGTRLAVFRDGALINQRIMPAPLPLGRAYYFSIGQEYDNGRPTDFLRGEVSELMIFGRGLTDTERKGVEQLLMRTSGIVR